MTKNTFAVAVIATLLATSNLGAQTNPLWGETKIKNYLPHMSWTEVEDLLTRTDMVLMPVGSLEQHGPHLPIGTDFLNGLERAKLVAQQTDVLVAPILFVGNAPLSPGLSGNRQPAGGNDSAGLLRGRPEPDAARLPPVSDPELARGQSRHLPVHRGPHQSRDGRDCRRAGRGGEAVSPGNSRRVLLRRPRIRSARRRRRDVEFPLSHP